MVKILVSFEKKHLYFLLFGIGIIILFGFVMAYNPNFPSQNANPAVFGHSPDEIVVRTFPGGVSMTLQTAIDGSEFGGWRKNGNIAFYIDGNVGIGTASPSGSAILDIVSTTRGFLPPRMTTVQRDAIVSPATGLIIFNTITNQHESRTSAGWVALGGGLVSKRVFVTSTTYNGSLGGLSGADSKCQERANAASLGGTWRAILSTSNVNARDRVGYSWDQLINMQGGIVAWRSSTINGMQDLWDGVIGTPIKYDEFGGISTGSIWSGSNSSGVYAPDVGHQAVGDCYAWTSSVFGWGGKYGMPSSTTSTWIDLSFGTCNQLNGLYCIEQ